MLYNIHAVAYERGKKGYVKKRFSTHPAEWRGSLEQYKRLRFREKAGLQSYRV